MNDAPINPKVSMAHRVIVSLAIGAAATGFTYIHARHWGFRPGDFNVAWFGAVALLHDANPYVLVGPDKVFWWPWPHLLLPATTFVAALPFAALPRLRAMLAFVFVSSTILSFVVTGDGWRRLPIFLSAPFVVGAAASQWSALLTAGVMWAPASILLTTKPTIGAAILFATSSKRILNYGLSGGFALLIASLIWYPAWPSEWLRSVSGDVHHLVPLLRPGGPLILFALLRWRRPEARLILALACVPQTPSWYEALPLLLVAFTYRENLIFALLTWIGFAFEQFVMQPTGELDYNAKVSMLIIAFVYLPATLMVLRRPNEGELPAWTRLFGNRLPARLLSTPG